MDGHHRHAAALLLIVMGGLAAPALAQNSPPVGNLRMPLVSPEQADQYFATRVVPPSDAPKTAPAAASTQPPQSVNVDPVLGHELPTDRVSPWGFPRADLPMAKPGGNEKRPAVSSTAVVAPPATGPAVIRQQVPTIGGH